MNAYKEYNDYELIYLVREGNESATEILYKKYKPVIELKARKYFKVYNNKGLDYNDLIQEGTIGFSEALRDFDCNKNVKLATFASLCIERQISSAVARAGRMKYKLLNESISLDYVDEEGERSLMDFIAEETENDPLEYFIDMESAKEVYKNICEKLTDFERQVLELKINNFNYKEIATILDKPSKSIDNALQRIKNKVRKIKND